MKNIYIVSYHNIYTGESGVIAQFNSKAEACFYIDKAERKNDNYSYSLEMSTS